MCIVYMYISLRIWYNVAGGGLLIYSDATKRATYKYHAAKIKRVPLDMQLSDYERVKAAADRAGLAVNTWIKQAIQEKLSSE